jgi:putative DNA primase/helicase
MKVRLDVALTRYSTTAKWFVYTQGMSLTLYGKLSGTLQTGKRYTIFRMEQNNTNTAIQHDIVFDIATGRKRYDQTWHNEKIRWSEFLNRISQTKVTGETVSEFAAMGKDRQSEIKDVGGFVGGYLDNGKRSNAAVRHRQLITLDIDNGVPGLWEMFTTLYDEAAAIYSTHKHTPDKPRYRLIIPLSHPLSADQYEAASRWIASTLGIEYFDDSTFEPARLMFWPSTSKDGEYFFRHQDGPIMDGENVLSENYTDWTDRSAWPYSEREPAKIAKSAKKQGEPTDKPYPVGAFCKAYTIDEAIDAFLSDVYRSDGPNRYTYIKGSSAKGVAVYDGGKFVYSNHGTDPMGGKLCNAFDMVRIHLYGDMDEQGKDYGRPSNMPSYVEMVKLCQRDRAVRDVTAAEHAESARDDFSGLDLSDESTMKDLLSHLDPDKSGGYCSTLKNFRRIVEGDPNLQGVKFDSFASRIVVTEPLPWDRKSMAYPRDWLDNDDSSLRVYLNDAPYLMNPKAQDVRDAFNSVVVNDRCFHPIRDYINSLVWDGTPRLESLFIDYFGAADTELNRAMTRKAFTACVARVFDPGCKFDNVLVIIGDEGKGKSTLLKKMGRKWFSDSITSIEGRDGMEQIPGKWVIEFSELASLNKSETEAIKSFISKTDDTYRAAYGRRSERHLRQCVFFATTNVSNFLRGYNGNRRFWPMETGVTSPTRDFFKDFGDNANNNVVDQLWAEAKHYYDAGELLFLDNKLETGARQLQDEHNEDEDFKSVILGFLDKGLPSDWDEMDALQRQNYFRFPDELDATGIFQRKKVTSVEIINECQFEKFGTPQAVALSRKIVGILRQSGAWRPIGKQRLPAAYGGGSVLTFERVDKNQE